MSSIGQLLLPCCFSDSQIPSETENKTCFSSASAHALTSLAVALVVGVGIALATYFLAHENIMWSAISGVGGGIVASSICYLILRYTFGKISRKISPTETGSRQNEIERNESLSPRLNPDQDNSSTKYPVVFETNYNRKR